LKLKKRLKVMAERVSLSEFGRRIGASPQAVSKAIQRGRLARSVGIDAKGRKMIADVALARREWRERASKPAPTKVLRPVPIEHFVVTELDGGLFGLVICADVDAETYDPRRDKIIAMTVGDAIAVGSWLRGAAIARRDGTDGSPADSTTH